MTARVKRALATNTIDHWLKHSLLRIKLVLKEYNPEQPREPEGSPEVGQWISTGDSQANSRNESDKPFTLAARPSKQFCERQYERDIFQCKMLGSLTAIARLWSDMLLA